MRRAGWVRKDTHKHTTALTRVGSRPHASPLRVKPVTALVPTVAAILLGVVGPAWGAAQLRVDPVLASRPDLVLQGARAKAAGLKPRSTATVLVQTPTAQYETAVKVGPRGDLTVDLPLAGAGMASDPDARSSVAVLEGGKSVAVASLPQFTGRGPGLLLLMGWESDALAYLSLAEQTAGIPLSGKVVSAIELPERWFAYGPVSAMVADAESLESLTPGQTTAFLDWLEGGGFLITYPGAESVGPRTERLALLAPLLPEAAMARPAKRDAAPLARAVGKGVSFGRPGVWPALAAPDAEVVGDGRTPFAATRRVGAGTWVSFAFDPADAAIDRSKHRKALWAWAFSRGAGVRPEPGTVFGRALWGEPPPPLRIPSGWTLAGLGLIYVALVGPVNFLILRRLDRRDLAWATIPVVSLVFTAAMFGVGFAARGGKLECFQTQLVVWGPGADRGVARMGVSVFSPRTARYKVDMVGEWVPVALSPGREALTQEPRFRAKLGTGSVVVRDLMVPRWTVRRLSALGMVRRPAPMEYELARKGNRVVGALRNVSSSMMDVWVSLPGRGLVPVGTLAPNQTRNVNVAARDAGVPKVNRTGWEKTAVSYMLMQEVRAQLSGGDAVLVAMPHKHAAPARVPQARNRVAVVWAMPVPGTAVAGENEDMPGPEWVEPPYED